ncbi:MAG: ribosome-binding factor A [Candidatus Babeliales bacterium]
MSDGSSVSHIKKSRKEANLFRIVSDLFMKIRMEDSRLINLFIDRVELTTDKSRLRVLFYTPDGQAAFKEKMDILRLYKPSMRKAIADTIHARYVPDLRFEYDAQFEKQDSLEKLLDEVSSRLKDHDNPDDEE